MIDIQAGVPQWRDQGRAAYQNLGYSPALSADPISHAWALHMLGLPDSHPVLELGLGRMVVRTEIPTHVALTGAFRAELNDQALGGECVIELLPGQALRLTCRAGRFGYLAIARDIELPKHRGSVATLAREGFHYAEPCFGAALPVKLSARPQHTDQGPIRYLPTYEHEDFSKSAIAHFETQVWQIDPASDSMGLRLLGETMNHKAGLKNSTPLAIGAIQWPSGGVPMVMAGAHQSIGGYPRIGCVLPDQLARLAQWPQRQPLQFVATEWPDARRRLKRALP